MPATLRLLSLSVCFILTTHLNAQSSKRYFSSCNSIVKELDSVRNSFNNLINVFKKEVILEDALGIEYSSDFTICGQSGIIERLEDRTNFIFTYNEENYIGSSEEFQRRFELFYKEIKLLFMETHSPTFRFVAAEEMFYEFNEIGKDAQQSNNMVNLLLTKRPGFMKVVLVFISKHREKKAF